MNTECYQYGQSDDSCDGESDESGACAPKKITCRKADNYTTYRKNITN